MAFGIGSFIKDKIGDVGSAIVDYNPITIGTDIVTGGRFSEDILGRDSKVFGTTADIIKDPQGALDKLTGVEGAEESAARVNAILKQSAEAGIALNEAQIAEIERLTAPFREAATGTALPQLSALAFGGDVDFQPSRLFQTQLEQGREGILKGQAAGPGIKSSATFGKLSDLVSGLAAEDVGRFERGLASVAEAGRGAEAGLTAAGSRLSGATGDILSGLGAGQRATAQQLAQAQIAGGQTLAGGLSGLSQLLLTA